MDVAVIVALAPLPVRSQEVESVCSGCRSAWLSSRARSRCGSSRSRCDRSRSLDRYWSHRDRWGSVDRSRSRHQRTRFSLPAGEIGVTTSGRTLSRIARVTTRGHAGGYLAPARLRAVEPGRLARRETQEGVEAFASQPPLVSEAAAAVPPFAGGAVFHRASV